jgi:seryl-tRNA synthetase
VLDLKLIRDDPARVRRSLARRGADGALDDLLAIDAAARAVRTRVEEAKAERKRLSKQIGQMRGKGEDSSELEAAARQLGETAAGSESRLRELEQRRGEILLELPNMAEDGAPEGGEEDAVVLREVGELPRFDFAIRDHVEIGEALGIIDLERAAKVSGARFAFLMGGLVRVQLAVVTFVLERLEKAGFTPVIPPVLVRESAMVGTGFFPTDRASIYETAVDDLFLVGTSEVPLAGLHQEEIVDAEALPLRYAGMSSCFRREAGAAGKDTRGIFRVHQFDKVEMFSFTTPGASAEEHQLILGMEEGILQALEIPYRVVDIAVGDLGASAARKFDCEAWMPGQQRYREVTSCSNCTDYQARRLRARFRGDAGTEVLHTLNGTAVALSRTLIAIIENHQREDGSVAVPEVLHAYGAPAELAAP